MHITLIGMSNIGKSHWSKRLAAEAGFERIACDEQIEQRLAPELVARGYAGIHDVARWMGQPFDAQYDKTSRKYLDTEHAVMRECIVKLRGSTRPIVIDTTGSVIYTGDEILNELRSLSRVVYLEASQDHRAHLFERYIAHPKPVIWNHSFTPKAGEKPMEALKRCYPNLLQSRAASYAKMAHVTLPFTRHRAAEIDWKALQ